MRKKLIIGSAAVVALAGTTIAVTALAVPGPDTSQDPTRIISALSKAQAPEDKLPANVAEIMGNNPGTKVDLTQTRQVGHGATLTYYAAPAGDKMCIIPVNTATSEGRFIGCTLLASFESGGLRFTSSDGKEEAWLVAPSAASKALSDVQSAGGWSQQAPNFLVKSGN